MSSALELRLRMPVAHFRNPFTFYYAQTYPLPPRSTVVGMLQSQLGKFDLGERLWVSIKGRAEAVAFNYVRMVKGKVLLTGEGLLNEQTIRKGKKEKKVLLPLLISQRVPTYQQELHCLELLIHVRGDDEILEDLRRALASPRRAISLGRGEDVAFLEEEPRIVRLSRDMRCCVIELELGTYIPEGIVKSGGVRYLMLEPSYVDTSGRRIFSVYAQFGKKPRPGISGRTILRYFEPRGRPELPRDGVELDFVEGVKDPLFWIGPPGRQVN